MEVQLIFLHGLVEKVSEPEEQDDNPLVTRGAAARVRRQDGGDVHRTHSSAPLTTLPIARRDSSISGRS